MLHGSIDLIAMALDYCTMAPGTINHFTGSQLRDMQNLHDDIMSGTVTVNFCEHFSPKNLLQSVPEGSTLTLFGPTGADTKLGAIHNGNA